ncbi:MAG: ABC transporter permease [bacterium]|jgi:putative ABC transport system permease protein|nr:ABC transporter permease [candidate division KSB1 bacterium]MDH7559068.1 ABC transporter permease [bacterium]
MNVRDIMRLACGNLRRNPLRAALTTCGVTIGIGALVSMVSFGTGMQKNVGEALAKLDAFAAIRVLPRHAAMNGLWETQTSGESKALTDSVVSLVASLPGVEMAYPEVVVPVRLRVGGRERQTMAQVMPVTVGRYAPYKEMTWGRFFASDAAAEIACADHVLRRMGFQRPDSLVGSTVELVAAGLDPSALLRLFSSSGPPKAEEVLVPKLTQATLVGVWQHEEFGPAGMATLVMPQGLKERLGAIGSLFDLLGGFQAGGGYPAVYVRAASVEMVEPLVETFEAMGYGTFTVLNELKELKKGFLVFDALLGAVGTVALVVAALGIVNTMVMSVLERYKEIGIMKAVGATSAEVKLLFVAESAAIGLMGGLGGLVLGWLVTIVANAVANHFLLKQAAAEVNFFYIPWWLVAGEVAFALAVSVVAGLFPARRAARVDPVQALRYE